MPELCDVTQHCLNCGSRCEVCIGSYPMEEWEDLTLSLHYKAAKGAPEHPYKRWKKGRAQRAKKEKKRSSAFKKKKNVLQKAARNEVRTRDAIVRATMNSGAMNGDGDSRLGDGSLGIDDKLQTKSRTQFVVKCAEITKAHQQDCIVVITTATGEKYVVSELSFLLAHRHDLAALGEASDLMHPK